MVVPTYYNTNFKYLKLIFQRVTYSTRVRFAPSPTGLLHVGGLKTALINYIFAKSSGGKLILRIEDTDQSRVVKDSVDHIIKSLDWLGIEIDEGVLNGKVNSKYIQSNRLDLYKEAANKLLKENKAYYCFCSSRRLEMLRKEKVRRGEQLGYDRKCLHLSKAEIENKLMQQTEYTIRLKIDDRTQTFHDIVFGDTKIQLSNFESDPILYKSDGYPVYHLANVVDDHEMEITHVIRGQEWHVSTPKHILLYEAFNWKPPIFAHLPLLIKENGRKISKRDADFAESFFNINILIEKGFTRETVISWLMSCGGGLNIDWYPTIKLHEIIDKFSLSRITKHNSKLDQDILALCGKHYFNDIVLTQNYYNDNIFPFLDHNSIQLDYNQLKEIFPKIKHRLICLKDLTNYSYLWSYPTVNISNLTDILNENHPILSKTEVIEELLNRLILLLKSENDPTIQLSQISDSLCKKSLAMKCIRMAIINQVEGPKITELFSLISSEELIHRLNLTLAKVQCNSKKSVT